MVIDEWQILNTSKPLILGVRAERFILFWSILFSIENSWDVSAICGTHLGLTKLPTSMLVIPALASLKWRDNETKVKG